MNDQIAIDLDQQAFQQLGWDYEINLRQTATCQPLVDNCNDKNMPRPPLECDSRH